LVTPTLLQGNRGMRIEVAGYGDMVFQLFEQRASRPTERVIELATAGFYDGILFHRVIDGFVIQGGDPTGTGSGGSTLGTFDDQFHVDLQHNQAGILSYAKSSDDTNDSQFFVTLGATRHLDFNHSIFGLLVEGKSVLDAIGKTATGTGDRPIYDIRMTTVEIFQDTENAVMMLKAAPAAIGQQANITVTVTDNTGNQVQDTFRVTVAADTVNGAPFLADLPDFQTTPGHRSRSS
jgi:large repetitive protein